MDAELVTCSCCGHEWDGYAQCYCMCPGCPKCTPEPQSSPPPPPPRLQVPYVIVRVDHEEIKDTLRGEIYDIVGELNAPAPLPRHELLRRTFEGADIAPHKAAELARLALQALGENSPAPVQQQNDSGEYVGAECTPCVLVKVREGLSWRYRVGAEWKQAY